jgi:hypothetical protein
MKDLKSCGLAAGNSEFDDSTGDSGSSAEDPI